MGDIVQEILNRSKNKTQDEALSDVYSRVKTYNVGGDGVSPKELVSLTDSDKPKKKLKQIGDQTVVSNENENELPMPLSNVPYKDTYKETDNVLKSSIIQLDVIASDIKHDLDDIRSSKTMKRKYDYISALTSSMSTVISSKISAARELNNTIKNCHDLELKRVKEMKLDNQVDDSKAIMDTYNAFVSMPVSSNPINGFSSPLGPSTADLTLMNTNMMAQAIGKDPEIGYAQYLQNMSPEQKLMLSESDPNIKQVVLYDPRTGATKFAMMNMATHQVLDLPTRDNSFLADGQTTFDFSNMRARNVNLDESYDIVTISPQEGMEMY